MGRRAAGATIALQLPWLATLTACARDEAHAATLSEAELRTLRAFAAQIIPSDADSVGAVEAGAPEFVVLALGRPLYSANLPTVRAGLSDLDARARRSGSRDFASASGAQQSGVLREIAATPFFTVTRTLIVVGTFSDPSHGGNRNAAAWTMIGIDHKPSYAPPYGWYDATPVAKVS